MCMGGAEPLEERGKKRFKKIIILITDTRKCRTSKIEMLVGSRP